MHRFLKGSEEWTTVPTDEQWATQKEAVSAYLGTAADLAILETLPMPHATSDPEPGCSAMCVNLQNVKMSFSILRSLLWALSDRAAGKENLPRDGKTGSPSRAGQGITGRTSSAIRKDVSNPTARRPPGSPSLLRPALLPLSEDDSAHPRPTPYNNCGDPSSSTDQPLSAHGAATLAYPSLDARPHATKRRVSFNLPDDAAPDTADPEPGPINLGNELRRAMTLPAHQALRVTHVLDRESVLGSIEEHKPACDVTLACDAREGTSADGARDVALPCHTRDITLPGDAHDVAVPGEKREEAGGRDPAPDQATSGDTGGRLNVRAPDDVAAGGATSAALPDDVARGHATSAAASDDVAGDRATSRSTPNDVASHLDDRAAAFEVYRRGSNKNRAFEENKSILRGKYAEAKALAEQASAP
jgi:hypothetical protein